MADITSITFAFNGFIEEEQIVLSAYFANADKWDPPWELVENIDNARVVIVKLLSEDDYGQIERLGRDLPNAEIVVFSSEKLPYAKWHLERQPSGKTPIVAFSKLVLKISHALKRKKPEALEAKTEAANSKIPVQPNMNEATQSVLQDQEELGREPTDMSSFFNTLDSILDSKPNEKRKRFNEK